MLFYNGGRRCRLIVDVDGKADVEGKADVKGKVEVEDKVEVKASRRKSKASSRWTGDLVE
jgi:hypothetical protein